MNVYNFLKKMSKQAFPYNLETGYSGKHTLISDRWNLYIFNIQMEIPKAVRITTIEVDLGDPSFS